MKPIVSCLLLIMLLVVAGNIAGTYNPIVHASYGMVTVQYLDGTSRPNADVWIIDGDKIGTTDSNGQVSCLSLSPPGYNIRAIYQGSQFGPDTFLPVPEGTTITANYEISPPNITVFSPENSTYSGRIVPLNFTVNDFSPVSWMGYSLDGQTNVTLSENTTMNVDAGQHNVVVYANDTYGNMGSSEKVYFRSLGGCIVIRVQYQDGYPRNNAIVKVVNGTYTYIMGTTNETGLVARCDHDLSQGTYQGKAFWPNAGTQFGYSTPFTVSENGDGSAAIEANYEITAPNITILSPQNQTYANFSIPLTYTIYDYSPLSWTGYSLDGQANVTITGNTTLTGLTIGSHTIVVYSNDTYGNMGSSSAVHFERASGTVTVRVQYLDGSPRSNAYVYVKIPQSFIGITDSDGQASCNYLNPGGYTIFAQYSGSQFGHDTYLYVDGNGDGSATIATDYEIAPPNLGILSPQNFTYFSSSVPLNFTVYDYSPISWMGYSLDGQSNITATGNTTLTVGEGTHSVVVFANDTFGNMGASQTVDFTFQTVIHDIAVSNLSVSKTVLGQTYDLVGNVTVENYGSETETANFTVYGRHTGESIYVIGTFTNIPLQNGSTLSVPFDWNTTDCPYGNYSVYAIADTVVGETNVSNNNFTLPFQVHIGVPGDISGPIIGVYDGQANMRDINYLIGKFNSKPGDPKWAPNADVNNDNVINMRDIQIAILNFNQHE